MTTTELLKKIDALALQIDNRSAGSVGYAAVVAQYYALVAQYHQQAG